ncbi:pyridoxamine 5'-phosphate oxidase [Streptomyces sp. Ncost-T6T-2b]|nr:pyridoxamine 5'-phosphate oxidase [Streptomyces sp. Ncost-T6T-2b]
MRSNDPMTDDISQRSFRDLLHAQRVWDTELPAFDPETAPAAPLALFHAWFAEAVAAGQPEPHAMSLATADAEGLPDVRTLLLHDADERGWHFASHATSAKGHQLAARPHAALGFYWPAQGRQVRVRGPVVRCTPAESHADLHARSTGALAAARHRGTEPGRRLGGRAAPDGGRGLGPGGGGAGRGGPDLDPVRRRAGRGRVLPGRRPAPPHPAALPP